MTDRTAPAGAPLVSVRGEATIETDPEIATLVAVVAARDRDRRRTLDRLAERNNDCLKLVTAYGDAIENVESRHLTVLPELRDGRGEKVRSYRGVVRIHVTVTDFAVLGELTTRLSDQELITVEGPSWRLRHDSSVYARARREAARAAVARARDYAEALGARLIGVVELADVGLSTDVRTPPPPVRRTAPWPYRAAPRPRRLSTWSPKPRPSPPASRPASPCPSPTT